MNWGAGVGLEVSIKFPSDADTADLEAHCENQRVRLKESQIPMLEAFTIH